VRNLLFVFLVSLTFLACKKERTIHVTATNVATGQRIPGLHYYLVELNSGTFGEKSKTIHEGDLDENGEAFITIKLKNTTHVIRVVEPDNNCYRENISLTFGPENFNADFKFAPCGTLQWKIHNIDCFDTNDKIEFHFVNESVPAYTDFSPLPRIGCYDNEFTVGITAGNWIAEWKVTKNGLSTNYDSTFVINENQTFYFLLEY